MKYCRFSVQCQFMMMFLRNKVVDLFIFQMHFKLCKKYIHTAHWRHWVIETYWEWALRSSLSFPTCFPGGSNGNESACDAGDQVQPLCWEDLLEKELATHSSTLVWRIPWAEKPGRLRFMGLQWVGHDWATSCDFSSSIPFPFLGVANSNSDPCWRYTYSK